ncbi:unnamed protein product, partial [Didymodactylos carnosus]
SVPKARNRQIKLLNLVKILNMYFVAVLYKLFYFIIPTAIPSKNGISLNLLLAEPTNLVDKFKQEIEQYLVDDIDLSIDQPIKIFNDNDLKLVTNSNEYLAQFNHEQHFQSIKENIVNSTQCNDFKYLGQLINIA